MRGENWEEIQKTGSGRIERAGDFSVIVNPNLWKGLKNDGGGKNAAADDDDDDDECQLIKKSMCGTSCF